MTEKAIYYCEQMLCEVSVFVATKEIRSRAKTEDLARMTQATTSGRTIRDAKQQGG